MTTQAIETVFRGHRFRSRLEARWAVFFSVAGLEYEYEEEGFITSNGGRYLPDFHLDNGLYVEVKPSLEALRKSSKLIGSAIDFRSTPVAEGGLIVLGPIPEVHEDSPAHPFFFWDKGVVTAWARFVGDGTQEITQDNYGGAAWDDLDLNGVSDLTCWWNNRPISPLIRLAYQRARAARFEHGESG